MLEPIKQTLRSLCTFDNGSGPKPSEMDSGVQGGESGLREVCEAMVGHSKKEGYFPDEIEQCLSYGQGKWGQQKGKGGSLKDAAKKSEGHVEPAPKKSSSWWG